MSEYKWIAQDKYGCIARYKKKPSNDVVEFYMSDADIVQKTTGNNIKNWRDSLINLETHDYKVEDGILMKVEKRKTFKASELQYNDTRQPEKWTDCTPYLEYRIKPKTVKFRNYMHNGNIYVSYEDTPVANSVIWLGDWIEVELPQITQQQWPTELVARIAKIDLQAAEWLRDNWRELDSKNYQECISAGKNSDNLSTMFSWRKSPQGYDYWDNIRSKLGR